jgi:hypothetical protein
MKTAVAVLLVLLWVPATSCCLLDASGLFGKPDCCAKDHSKPVPKPGGCDKACGLLASALYFSQQSQALFDASMDHVAVAFTYIVAEPSLPLLPEQSWPATGPPELAGHWQFSYRTALPPRAPSLAS